MLNIDEIAKKAFDTLKANHLADLKGRPFDNAFINFLKKDKIKPRIVVVGFNGSDVDGTYTNQSALEEMINHIERSNIEEAKGWGRLAKQLKEIPTHFGLKYCDVVYTNAILCCSKDAQILKNVLKENENLIENSMHFFCNFTCEVFNPDIIVCHGNAETSLSTASILYRFLNGSPVQFDGHGNRSSLAKGRYSRAYWFYGSFKDKTIPVLCLRHLSRYRLNTEAIDRFKTLIEFDHLKDNSVIKKSIFSE